MELRTNLEASEAAHGESGIRQHLADGLLVVLGVVLVEQGDLLVEGSDASLNDLRKGSLGLALATADLLDDATLVLDRLGRNLVARQVLRVGERDVLATERAVSASSPE